MKLFRSYHIPPKVVIMAGCLFAAGVSAAQTTVVTGATPVTGTTVVISGREYNRSGYHNFFWGRHYRTEWNTPVRVSNFYLDTAAGGLQPYAKGGGRQSSTLRLRAKNGKEYVLRSIDKDFGRALPESVRGTFMSRIAKDQVSIGHPFSGITIAPMSEAAGIYHTTPVIVFVPVQPALGEYNDEYGNQLYLFEERPDGNQEDATNFGNAVNLIGTDRLLEHIYKDNDNHVDQEAFLRVRLFDMFIGDWGRHPDNWRWAKFEQGKDNIYKPVPRDRDQAYTIMDGFYPSLAAKFYKPFQGFHHTIKKIGDWNLPARSLDKLLLNGLEKDAWIRQATQLQQVLTDSLISYSIRQMPPELFAVSGEDIIDKLKSRRDHLAEYAADYYDFLASYVDLPGTHDRELFTVNRLGNGEAEIAIYKITKEGIAREQPFYKRKFTKEETKEVRIYGLEDEDRIEIKGTAANPLKVRIIDPGGSDSVVFEQKELHKGTPVSSGRKYEYDTAHEKKWDITLRPVISSSRYKIFDADPVKLFPRTGIKLVAGITYNTQPWKKTEYEIVHHVCANYGVIRKAFNVGYVGWFGHLVGKWNLVLKARLDAPAVENYFGTGNNTENLTKSRGVNYYQTFSTRMFGAVSLERDFLRYHHAEFSVIYQSVKVQKTADHYISDVVIDPLLFETNQYAGLEGGYSFAKTNDPLAPTKGFGFNLGAMYMKNLTEDNQEFLKVLASAFAYVPLSRQFSWAIRAGGGTIAGDAPYYYQNTVGGGGAGEVRGYDRERFYGKQSAHLNNDLRWLFNTKNWLFNGKAGLLGFYDIGRVWQSGESSSLWHDSYGFGILLVPYNKFAVSATYGISAEGNYTHFKAGLFF